MTEYCVIKFLDETCARISPTELIKYEDNRKFVPKSAKDLPDEPVRVKWQRSMSGSGSFSNDGYFPADVVAIAGSVKTAKAKATELGCKLALHPLLELPSAAAVAPTTGRKKGRGEDGAAPDSTRSASKDASDKSIGDKDKKVKERGSKMRVKKPLKLNEVSLDRLKAQLETTIVNNPLITSPKHQKPESGKDNKAEQGADWGNDDSLEAYQGKDNALDTCSLDSTLQAEQQEVDSQHGDTSSAETHQGSACSGDEEDKEDGDTLIQSHNVKHTSFDRSDEGGTTKATESSESDNENNVMSVKSLPDAIKSFSVPSSPSQGNSSSSASSESETKDETSKLAAEVNELKAKLKNATTELIKVKKDLDESNRAMSLANNLRIAHKEEVECLRKELESLKKELTSNQKQIGTLQKRNEMLQDMLCNDKSGSKHQTTKRSGEKHSGEKHSGEKHSGEKHSGEKLSEKKIKSSTPVKPDIGCSDSSRGSLTDLSVTQISPVKRHSEDNGSAPEKKKKKKREDLDHGEIDQVCSNVLSHLKKEVLLEEDKKGFVSLGLGVHVNKSELEKTLNDHKEDVQKISKNLTALAWTSAQRRERSLEGGVNNRFPNAPAKKAATPQKVNACLGVVKAHLLHSGDNDGPGMKSNLKICRKAIGYKFAQDCNLAKKRGEI